MLFANKLDWRYRAIEQLQGNQSLPGCILIAALHKSDTALGVPRSPSFGHTAQITPQGYVVTRYVDKAGIYQGIQAICQADEMIDAFRRLADTLKLTDADRTAMFTELRRWVTHDRRLNKLNDFEPIPSPKDKH